MVSELPFVCPWPVCPGLAPIEQQIPGSLTLFAHRKLQVPQGFSPEPTLAGACTVIQNMRAMPVLYGGLVLDVNGVVEPAVVGGCTGNPCNKGEVFLFDSQARGWETVSITSYPYPPGRAGHTLTGSSPALLSSVDERAQIFFTHFSS